MNTKTDSKATVTEPVTSTEQVEQQSVVLDAVPNTTVVINKAPFITVAKATCFVAGSVIGSIIGFIPTLCLLAIGWLVHKVYKMSKQPMQGHQLVPVAA